MIKLGGNTIAAMKIGAVDVQAAYLGAVQVFGGAAPFSPASLFANGEQGVWLDISPDTCFTDTAGATPAGIGDGVASVSASAGTIAAATQPDINKRPILAATPNRITFDLVDDNMSMDFTGKAGAYTLLQGSQEGIVHAKVNVPNGAYSFTTNPSYFPSDNITGYILREGALTASDVAGTKTYLQDNGAGADFAGVTDMSEWFRGRTDLVELNAGDWDTSSVTDFGFFTFAASSLVSLDVSGWDTSSVTNFRNFAREASSLTTLDVSDWNTSSVTDFGYFAFRSSSLTTLDVSGWDTSSVTDFGSFAREASSLTTLDVSGWNTSSVTDFSYFTFAASSLVSLDVSGWDTSSVTNFRNFAREASSLTTLDVSDWNTSSVTDFGYFAFRSSSLTTVTVNGGTGSPFADSPCTNYSNAFTDTNLSQQSIDDILVAIEAAGTSNGTFDQSGGSAPSATGEAAIDALRGRGWTITVTGGY
jgi:surface protein